MGGVMAPLTNGSVSPAQTAAVPFFEVEKDIEMLERQNVIRFCANIAKLNLFLYKIFDC